MPRKRASRVIVAGLFGCLLAFLALELLLRLVGGVSAGSAVVTGSGPRTMLFAGNSHTLGVHTTQGNCYPEKLGRRLAGWRIVNGAELNMNSAQVLRKLPGLLQSERPEVVVLMVGEPNWWNRRLMPGRPWGWFEDTVTRVRVARWLLQAFRAKEDSMSWREHYSPHFLATPLSETPTLSLRWVGVLTKEWDLDKLTPPGRITVAHGLEQWVKDPRSGDAYAAKVALVRLWWKIGKKKEALALASDLAESGPFLMPLFRWAREQKKEGTGELVRKLELKAPRSDPATLKELIVSDPGNPAYFSEMGKLPPSEAIELTRRLLRENPFYANGEMPKPEAHPYLPREKFYELLAEALPPSVDPTKEKPALPFLRTGFPNAAQLEAWARADLEAAIGLVRAAGAKPVLQTYPPERWVGRERGIDRVIRAVAREKDVPLSDTASALTELFRREKREGYFGTPGLPFADDHLNDAGNDFVAGLLERDLKAFGLLP